MEFVVTTTEYQWRRAVRTSDLDRFVNSYRETQNNEVARKNGIRLG